MNSLPSSRTEHPTAATMADVEMADAPTSTTVVKKKGGAADGEGKEGKKRFEVKKVFLDMAQDCFGPC